MAERKRFDLEAELKNLTLKRFDLEAELKEQKCKPCSIAVKWSRLDGFTFWMYYYVLNYYYFFKGVMSVAVYEEVLYPQSLF